MKIIISKLLIFFKTPRFSFLLFQIRYIERYTGIDTFFLSIRRLIIYLIETFYLKNQRSITLNDYGNYGNYDNNNTNNLNLYNPMINRDIQNSNNNSNNNNNDNDTIYTLNNYLLSLNINNNNNNNTYMDCGLNKIELEKNSKIIECNNDTDCPICLCKYPQYTHFYLMNCNHYFCIECSKNWFSKKSVCPLCRKNYKKL